MPLFTTSRKPCARSRTLVKELARIVPGSATQSRGKKAIDDVAEDARHAGHTHVAVITESHGNPAAIRAFRVTEDGWRWHESEFLIKGLKLSRDFGNRVHRADEIAVDDTIGFANALGIEHGEGDTELRAAKDSITFFQAGEEVGPRITLRGIRHGNADKD